MEIPVDGNKVEDFEEKVYLPKLLYMRLSRRENAKLFSLAYFMFNFTFLILGALFLDATWRTRNYVIDGIIFWKYFEAHKLGNKEIVYACTVSGILTLFIFAFNAMNYIVIFKHTYLGGLRNRLKFSQYVHLIIQSLFFIYSLVLIIKYQAVITLVPVLFVFCIINVVLCIILFRYLWKILKRETDYMMSLQVMNRHKLEYLHDYQLNHKIKIVNKVRAITNFQGLDQNRGENDNKIHINK